MSAALLAARLILVAILVLAGIGKLADRQGARQAVALFGVPEVLSLPVATVLPFVELAAAVLHIILSHHGQLEHGSPVVPATREATLVHMVDNLGGRLGSFDRLEKALPDGSAWSAYDRALGGGAWFASRAASCRRSVAARPVRVINAGPVRISGRWAAASHASIASAFSSSSAIASAAKASASGTCTISASPSRQSVGRLRCTGPRRPERAVRIAMAKSRARSSARALVLASLQSGAAMAAWHIS